MHRHPRIGIVPRELHHVYVKRANDNSNSDASSPATDDNNDSKPTPSSSSNDKPSHSSGSSSNDKHTHSSSEHGTLEPDQTEQNSDEDKSNGGDNSSDDEESVATDNNGNPIITDFNVETWGLIKPTGVDYISGASSLCYSTVTFVSVLAAITSSALF